MDNDTFDRALAQSITEARESAGISLNALSGMSGIPYATLHRKIHQAPSQLSIRDINAIAKSLNVTASDLFPEVTA
jgi:transcriptional regulator with XRE-family HTH domain